MGYTHLLTPVVSIPKNEALLWNDAEFMNALTKGISQATSGRTKHLDHLVHSSKEMKLKRKTTKSGQGNRAKVKV